MGQPETRPEQHSQQRPDRQPREQPLQQTQYWPALDYEEQIWLGGGIAQVGPAATRASGYGQRYRSAVPPLIASLSPRAAPELEELAREAEDELQRFDAEHGEKMRAFAPILLRSEAAASSQIEHLTASARQIFTAELGGAGKRNAAEIVANTRSMEQAIALSAELSPDAITQMHRVLMDGQPRHTPGVYRDQPVWIGRSAASPIGAIYVAPAHERVPELLDDLTAFVSRYDTPPLVQIAVAHAQFETIHPFTDGNGRTGRALAQAMLRRRRLTRNVAVPVSAGLLVDIDAYHQALTDYRAGDIAPIIESFAVAALRAVPNGRRLIADIDEIGERWLATIKPRARSAKERLIDYALHRPVFTAEMAAEAVGVGLTNVYRDLRALQEQGFIAMKSEYRGPTAWRQQDVLDAIDAFAARAGRRG
jgi:Fic family protein